MRVTVKKLEERGACNHELQWFKQRWPTGCETTLANLTKVAERSVCLIYWFVGELLKDRLFEDDLMSEAIRLRKGWLETEKQNIIYRVNDDARRFVQGYITMTEVSRSLRNHKSAYKLRLSELEKTITTKLVRIVYDRVKPARAPVKKRRPK